MKEKLRIMVVDDNPANLKLAGDLLEIDGYDVVRCVDAETALDYLKNDLPVLILMDVALPGMDGLELTRALKADERTKDVIIVALTAFAMKSDKDKVLAAGCNGYITKPIDTRQFISQIREYLNEAKSITPSCLLLVDDNPTSLKLLQAVYESEGYSTLLATNGLDALRILEDNIADLIVTDVLMPDMDGYYLCYKIRSSDRLKNIPIIIYTATYTSSTEESVAREMGADLFIRKPAPVKLLVSSAKEILSSSYKPVRAVLNPPAVAEGMHKYSSELINRLEKRNIELEETKEQLQLTLKRFSHAQQIAHLGHWELDLATGNVTWSDETFQILGLRDTAGTGLTIEDYFRFIHPEDKESVKAMVEYAIASKTPYSFRHRLVQPEGSLRHVHVRGQFEFDRARRPINLYGTILDVTDIVEKEEKLQSVHEELEAFIYKSSHDLNGPIATLLGLVSVAKMEIKDQALLTYIGNIDTVTHKLKTTISQLLKIMHLRKRSTYFEAVNVNELLDEIIKSYKHVKGYEKIKFIVNNQLKHPLKTDREIISTVLSNLLENAIKYQKEDTSNAHVKVDVLIDPETKNTSFEITDNGIGIPTMAHDKVFNMFYRGAERSQGSGLGLYLVKNAIDQINGTIEFSSNEGEGSTFKISLPA